ncbi:MAG: dockerin type I repeat-containing protein [Ruminococcus sp.]|nr:dockerin type I repeat-containing protein [Ruminococcus sp.]
MKKLVSLITSGMLAAMPMMPLTINAETAAFSANAKTAGIVNTSTVSNTPYSEGVPATTTQALKTDELRADFYVDEPEYNIYVGEQIDLNDITFHLSVHGYLPDGTFQASPISLNYHFSAGSGKHSDCYKIYKVGDWDTSKAGRYRMSCKLNGGVKETFDIENSGSPDVPDGKYEMIMDNYNFNIHINVIDPNVTSPAEVAATTTQLNSNTHNYNTTATSSSVENVTAPQSSGMVTAISSYPTTSEWYTATTTLSPVENVTETQSSGIITAISSYTTTAVTEEWYTATAIAPPAEGEIRAIYTCQETYTVNVGEEFNPDDIELSVYAWSAVPNQYQIDYKFTIGSGKHSNCFTYDASNVDTSKPGTYYVVIANRPNVKDTYIFDSSNSYNVPEGEYEMITEGRKVYAMVPVYVAEPAPSVSTLGDANDDGYVNIADATAIIQHIGNKDAYGLSEQGIANADVNNDGMVTGVDAVAIQMRVANMIKSLPYTE